MAVKVLPAPVAMWTRARGRLAARDCSRPVTAAVWQSRRFSVGSGGMASCRRRRSVEGCASHAANVSGRKKLNTSRERGAGSRVSVNRVILPVASNRKGSGSLLVRHFKREPE